MAATFHKYPKQEGNDCKECEGTGVLQWFDIDGCTIYSWQKPKTAPCKCTRKETKENAI